MILGMLALYQLDDSQLIDRCTISHGKSRGPGGQHLHAHASAVTVSTEDPAIRVQCQDFRSANENQKRALKELRLHAALLQRGYSDPSILPKYLHQKRINIKPNNPDYPLLIGLLFDVLQDHNYEMASAAHSLDLSTSQLIKVCGLHKLVWAHLQDCRKEFGHKPLKHR